MSWICWGLAAGSSTWLVCLNSSLSPRRVRRVQSVWLALEFALHILNSGSKSKLLAESTSTRTCNWKVKKSKLCLSRKLPVEAVAHIEKSEGIWDSSNGIVWFLFGCPGWNLIVLHMKMIISSCRITFHSSFRCKYLAEKPREEETEDENLFSPKAVISVPLFYLRLVCVTSHCKTLMEIAKSWVNRAEFWSFWPWERFIWRLR